MGTAKSLKPGNVYSLLLQLFVLKFSFVFVVLMYSSVFLFLLLLLNIKQMICLSID